PPPVALPIQAVDQAGPPATEPDSPPGPPENRDGDSGDDVPGDDSPGEDPPGEDPHDGDSTGGEPDPDDDPDGTGPGGRGAGNSGAARSGPPASGPARPPRWEVPGLGEGAPGRRSRAQTRNGRVVRATTEPGTGLHLLGTVFAAAPRQHLRERAGGGIVLAPEDLRGAYREGREGNLVVFVVDASGSMAARDRLSAVTGAIVTLLRDAYQRRDKVAVISVRGAEAELVLPPTSSVDIAVRRLAGLRTGGKTPLAAGLLKAREIVHRERVRDPRRRPMLVLRTDGRATGGADPVGRAKTAAGLLAGDGVTAMVVDCERGMIRLGLAAELARALRGSVVRLGELTGEAVAEVVRAGAGRAASGRSTRAA